MSVNYWDKTSYGSGKYVIPVVCVKIGKGMQSNTAVSIKVYLMAILDNYMFRPLLAIFRWSSRKLNLRSYYKHARARAVEICTYGPY